MEVPTRDVLLEHHCWEPGTDRVPHQPDVTAFKQRARLHQSLWREEHGYPPGTHPYKPKAGEPSRPIGSRLEYGVALSERPNMLTDEARIAALTRTRTPQPHQMLNTDRLWCDLLSSMPLCFNLFGPLTLDLDLARQAVSAWFPDAPGTVAAVHLEWSPGRLDPDYLGNRTAFDAAIELDLGDGTFGILGIETKYHEHLHPERPPTAERLARYRDVAEHSQVFTAEALAQIEGDTRQQIWQDHLLALAMLQHPSRRWAWAQFVVAHPAANPSFDVGVTQYAALLADPSTFAGRTLDSMIDQPGALPTHLASPLRSRYLW
jgi:hypothetical protein